MDDRTFEHKLGHLMKQDFSEGTDEFRDALLARCLEELSAEDEGRELDDDVLDMLAAAGDPNARVLRDDAAFPDAD